MGGFFSDSKENMQALSMDNLDCTLDAIVYIRTDLRVCLERVIGRGRVEERVDRDSMAGRLESLHVAHDLWLLPGRLSSELYARPPVFVLDGDQAPEIICEDIERNLRKLLFEKISNITRYRDAVRSYTNMERYLNHLG